MAVPDGNCTSGVITRSGGGNSGGGSSSGGGVELGINRLGNDIANHITNSAQTCERICKDHYSSCKAWTFVKSENKCWIKNGPGIRVPDPNTISGVK
jgi:hypothetical protein